MTLFPTTKEDFTAENGVTYTWDENRWRTKAYKIDDSKLENYVTKGDFDAGQGAQDQRIDDGEKAQVELQNKVNALEGAVGDHKLLFTTSNSNVRHGEFNLKNMEMGMVNTISAATFISISEQDLDGNSIDRDKIQDGDVIRIVSIDGDTSDLKIESGGTGFYKIESATGSLDRLSEIPYDFVLLSSFDPSGLATIEYVDAQDALKLDKAGGTATGNFDFDGDCLIRVNGDLVVKDKNETIDGDNLFGAYGDSQRVQYWGKVDDAKCVTTKEYSDGKFLHKAGGTMTGALECARPGTGNVYLLSVKAEGLPEGNQVAFRVTGDGAVKAGHNTTNPFMATAANDVVTKGYLDANGGGSSDNAVLKNASNDVTTAFRIKANNNTLISASGNELGLYHVKTPTDQTHGANKSYVDSKSSRAQTGVDTAPTLDPGEFYFCTLNKTLIIGT